MKQKIILFFFLIASITFLFILIKLNEENQLQYKDKYENNSNETETLPETQTIISCEDKIKEQILGTWKYRGGDFDIIPFLQLNEDYTFNTNAWGSTDQNKIAGTWNLNKMRLILNFNDDNIFWKNLKLTDEQINQFKLSVDKEKNLVTINFGYSSRTEDFVGECDLGNVHIDIMNVLLHKEIF